LNKANNMQSDKYLLPVILTEFQHGEQPG